jgi:hypothetical protein
MKTIKEIWDGEELRLSFRRCFDNKLLLQWEELKAIVQQLRLMDEPDQMVWKLNSTGVYFSQSLYAVINFRGVKQVYIPAIWKLNVPPRVQVFLWLVSHNKILTRDNLAKRQTINDGRCLFCCEPESMCHLFFECDVARDVWSYVSSLVGRGMGNNYEQVARLWISNEKNGALNTFSSAVIWNLWKMRNELHFGSLTWTGFQVIWMRMARLLRRWMPLCKEEWRPKIGRWRAELERKAMEMPRVEWY